jgi:hypothetical protein
MREGGSEHLRVFSFSHQTYMECHPSVLCSDQGTNWIGSSRSELVRKQLATATWLPLVIRFHLANYSSLGD